MLLGFLLCFLCVLATQPVPTSTIIDVLSSSPEFSEILHLIQARGLVTFINQQWNCSFLAPVNSAFIGIDKDSITRDQILYHLINTTVYSGDISVSTGIYYTYLDDFRAPISLSLKNGVNSKVMFDNVDLLASPRRGVVHGVLEIVDIPPDLEESLFLDPDLQQFASLVDLQQNNLNGSLVLAPSNDALEDWISASTDWDTSEAVLRYLQSPFGKRESRSIVERHCLEGLIQAMFSNHPLGDSKFPLKLNLLDGTPVKVYANYTVQGPDFLVEPESAMVVTRDALVLPVSSMATPDSEHFLNLTPEKIILGIGGYQMVRELSLSGNSYLIDGTQPDTKKRTIVVPVGGHSERESYVALAGEHANFDKHANSDDTLRLQKRSSDIITDSDVADSQTTEEPEITKNKGEFSTPGSLMLYQFLDGTFPKNKQSALLDTELQLKSDKFAQRVHFERRSEGSPSLNWEKLDSTPYTLGNTSFYVAHDIITPPPSLAMSLGPMLISSFSLNFLDKLDRLQLPLSHSWTVLIPNRDSWDRNILLKYYLDNNLDALERLFDNLILNAPIYSDQEGTVTVEQYNGLKTDVTWNSQLNEFTLNNSAIQQTISTEVTDALFNNGVAHVVDDIPLPEDLEVSTVDLISSGGRTVFLDLLRAADMEYVLEPSANYTILVPPNKDLRRSNYTTSTDPKKLKAMLELHLLPENPLEELFKGSTASTLSGEEIESQLIGASSKLLALAPRSAAEGQRILLYQYGFTNGIVAGGSSVVFTDRHISPKWVIPVKFGLQKGTYTIFGVLLGLLIAILLVCGLLFTVSKKEEPLIEEDIPQDPYYDSEEDAEATPNTEAAASSSANGTQNTNTNTNTNTDSNGQSKPIETPGVSEDRAYGRHLDLPTD